MFRACLRGGRASTISQREATICCFIVNKSAKAWVGWKSEDQREDVVQVEWSGGEVSAHEQVERCVEGCAGEDGVTGLDFVLEV